MANELLSIVENAGLMGVPIPEVIVKAIEVLKHGGKAPIDRIDDEDKEE
jgi:phage-related holin